MSSFHGFAFRSNDEPRAICVLFSENCIKLACRCDYSSPTLLSVRDPCSLPFISQSSAPCCRWAGAFLGLCSTCCEALPALAVFFFLNTHNRICKFSPLSTPFFLRQIPGLLLQFYIVPTIQRAACAFCVRVFPFRTHFFVLHTFYSPYVPVTVRESADPVPFPPLLMSCRTCFIQNIFKFFLVAVLRLFCLLLLRLNT